MDCLRFATVGSVDDGKSTLIGRLLFDSKNIFEDQLDHIEAVSKKKGNDFVDLSLLTDGLRAEREQGITIDVAYRYFSTPRRSFVVADCPGHIQYTRNMVTGASNVDLAIILIDARTGVAEQTRRHSLLASLLGVPHLVVCVNKMDLVDWSEEVFDSIRASFEQFSAKLSFKDISFIPISALLGDNVVEKSPNLSWFKGSSLLYHLETVYISGDKNLIDARFPVQYVIRPQMEAHPDYRGYAGRVASGVFKEGDDVVVLPSGLTTKIERIETPYTLSTTAKAGTSATLVLRDDLSISRGDMICRLNNRPRQTQSFDAMLCWMDSAAALDPNKLYYLKHTTKTVRVKIKEVLYKMNISTLSRIKNDTSISMNDIGRVSIHSTEPLFLDPYQVNRVTGSFILIDEDSNQTAAAGMALPPRT